MTDGVAITFAGARARLFGLALKTGIATILTLGLYGFWGRTRLRRWYWSAIRPGGHPLEYRGEGAERFAGFLIATVILALWAMLVNGLVMVTGRWVPDLPQAGYAIGAALLVPVVFWARYRARAHTLSRSAWRGIGFGMAPGAAGYAWRACLHWVLTIASLGLLWPWMTFRLEKFRTDRTRFGTERFEQGGRALRLYPAFVPALLAGWSCLGALALGMTTDPRLHALAVPLGVIFVDTAVRYRVRAFGIMASDKRLGDLRLTARPSAARIGRIAGYGGLAILGLLCLPAVGLVLAIVLVPPNGVVPAWAELTTLDPASLGPATWLAVGLFGLVQGTILLICGALRHAIVTAPILRHLAESVVIEGACALAAVRQYSGAAGPGVAARPRTPERGA